MLGGDIRGLEILVTWIGSLHVFYLAGCGAKFVVLLTSIYSVIRLPMLVKCCNGNTCCGCLLGRSCTGRTTDGSQSRVQDVACVS